MLLKGSKIRFAGIIFLSLILTTFLLGCGQTAEAPNSGEKDAGGKQEEADYSDVTIRLADRLTTTSVLFKGKNYADKYGLKVETTPFASGTEIRDALISGDIDVGDVGITPLLTALSQTSDSLSVVGISGFGGGNYSVVVGTDSSYAKIEDLVGKKIAVKVGSGCYSAFLLWAQNAGYDGEKDFQILDMGDVDAMAALENGSVDATVYWEPIPSILESKGVGKIIADYDGLVNNPTFLVARTEFVDQNPELVARFVAAWADMSQMMFLHVDEAAKISAEELNSGGIEITEELYKKILPKTQNQIWLYPDLLDEAKESFEILKASGKTDANAQIDWSKVYRADITAKAQEILIDEWLKGLE